MSNFEAMATAASNHAKRHHATQIANSKEQSMQLENHYSTLRVDRCASCTEIKTAFRTLAQRFHPDVTKDRDGERQFKDVAEAYRTLRRPDSKVAYDRQINNFCGDKAALTINLPDIGNFTCGLAIFQYDFWFWLNQNGDGE